MGIVEFAVKDDVCQYLYIGGLIACSWFFFVQLLKNHTKDKKPIDIAFFITWAILVAGWPLFLVGDILCFMFRWDNKL